jgi:hypothetical protein
MRVTLLATTNSRSYRHNKHSKSLIYLRAILVAYEESVLDFDHTNHLVDLVLLLLILEVFLFKLVSRLCRLQVVLGVSSTSRGWVVPGAKCGALIVVHVLLGGIVAGAAHLLLVLVVEARVVGGGLAVWLGPRIFEALVDWVCAAGSGVVRILNLCHIFCR